MQVTKRYHHLVKLIFFTLAFLIFGNKWLNAGVLGINFSISNAWENQEPTLAQASPAQTKQSASVAATYSITLTHASILPQILVVPTGAQVVCYNATGQPQTLRSGVANLIFLPLIQRSGGQQAQNVEAAPTIAAPELATGNFFSATIVSGASFTPP